MPFPQTLDELRKGGYRFDRHSHCAGCNAVIEWWITPLGKRMPMDVTDSGKAQAHWASCPKADEFRKVARMTAMHVHHHSWGLSGKCHRCDAIRCVASAVQFRRGKPMEMQCKARAFTKTGLCMRCDERQRQTTKNRKVRA